MYDIIIVGGGPAGSTLARLIGKKYKVLLLEKRDFNKPLSSGNQKCCGGLIAPDAQRMLAAFGLGVPKSVLTGPQLFSVRTIDIPNSIERYYQCNYININREEFDKWLESLLPSEVDVINGCLYKSYTEENNLIRVQYFKDGHNYDVKTKLLVGADGAFSKIRLQAFPQYPMAKTYVAIQEWFTTNHNLNYYGAIFDKSITDFYSWTIPKENCLILGAALTPYQNSFTKFESLKVKLKDYGFRLGKRIRREGTFLLRPQKNNQINTGTDKYALIGEAAGFISPSSAEGLSYAFKSALALAKTIDFDGKSWHRRYQREVQPLVINILGKNLKAPFMYNCVLRKMIMETGLMSIKLSDLHIQMDELKNIECRIEKF